MRGESTRKFVRRMGKNPNRGKRGLRKGRDEKPILADGKSGKT